MFNETGPENDSYLFSRALSESKARIFLLNYIRTLAFNYCSFTVNRSHTCFHMPYYQTLRKPYSSFIEYLQILSGGKIDDVFY